jgi:hypothetical protein
VPFSRRESYLEDRDKPSVKTDSVRIDYFKTELLRLTSSVLCKQRQLLFGDDELPKATVPADYQFREYENGDFVNIFESLKMNRQFAVEATQILGATCLTPHGVYLLMGSKGCNKLRWASSAECTY